MVDFDPSYARKMMGLKTNEELMLIAQSDTTEWREEVIQFATEELGQRGINEITLSKEEAREKLKHRGREERAKIEKGFRVRWLHFYVGALIPLGIGLEIITIAVGGDIVSGLFAIALGLTLLVGLARRRLWGWVLNWLCLALVALSHSREAPGHYYALAVFILLCLLPNSIYFYKRRALFE